MYPSPRDECVGHILGVNHQFGARGFSSGGMAEERVLVGEVLGPGGFKKQVTRFLEHIQYHDMRKSLL